MYFVVCIVLPSRKRQKLPALKYDIRFCIGVLDWHVLFSNDYFLRYFTRLGAGWSVHTNKQTAFKQPVNLTPEEQEQIVRVIRKADMLEQIEQERIGYVLVVNSMKPLFIHLFGRLKPIEDDIL